MTKQVRTCPHCGLLMWVKEEDIEYADENTMRVTCPHCHKTVRLTLVSVGPTAAGPKMGH